MGAIVTISLYAGSVPTDWQQDVGKYPSEMERGERFMSSNIPENAIGQINRLAGREYVSVHPDVVEILAHAWSIIEISSRAFDVTVWPRLRLWGFDSENPFVPIPRELEKAITLVDYSSVALTDSSIRQNSSWCWHRS